MTASWSEEAIFDALVECDEIFEATGKVEVCIARFPMLRREITEHYAFTSSLRQVTIPEPYHVPQAVGRRQLLEAVAVSRTTRRFARFRLVAGLGGAATLLCLTLGISAAAAGVPGVKSGFNAVLDTLGISSTDNGQHNAPGQPRQQVTPDAPAPSPAPTNLENSQPSNITLPPVQLPGVSSPSTQPILPAAPLTGVPGVGPGNRTGQTSSAAPSTETQPSTAPGVTTTSPGQNGSAPGQTGSAPGQNGSAPGQNGSAPGQNGSAPGQNGSAPGQNGSAPGQNGSAPGQNGSAPGQSGSAPGQSGSAPGQSGSAPGQSGSAPGQSGSAPGQSGSAPGQSGSAPGQSGSAPGQSGSAPGQSGSAPGQSGSAPGQSGSAPGQSGSAPGQSGSAPGQSGSAPGQSGSAPGQSGSNGNAGGNGNGNGNKR